ncbi:MULTISPECIES: ABC transporter ATP-binding protein [Cellulomonas]|uniref:ABC-2 type transport system ATP-binding protein n=1 Tax=Cellulomonas iranensis TaxID=76862 RepID=A0ABU0GJY9_9CELL|nr:MULTISPECIES: ABC transporter ATP-binding protein [Cellulomonas]MDQ0425638.1 ABC-2 type transport system ATP-binding protein [Cellulomonas iranensis]TFH72079.1 ABC transporter ATP-binding protein [Cellulomonas sp. HD19AZ1]
MTSLRLDRVSLGFGHGDGVHDVTMSVAAGEIVALVGLNGAGKSTLMRLALGMLRPARGTVHVLGAPLATAPARSWARVGALVEVPLAYPELTTRENLHLAALLHHADPGCVDEALDQWQLRPVADRRFRRLSLGTRQRVGLAAALQHRPDLVVLDEPSNALDPASVILLREHLTRRAADGAAVLVSSHHLDEVARTAGRTLLMNRGRLIGELATDGPDVERAFFDRIHDDDRRAGVGTAAR